MSYSKADINCALDHPYIVARRNKVSTQFLNSDCYPNSDVDLRVDPCTDVASINGSSKTDTDEECHLNMECHLNLDADSCTDVASIEYSSRTDTDTESAVEIWKGVDIAKSSDGNYDSSSDDNSPAAATGTAALPAAALPAAARVPAAGAGAEKQAGAEAKQADNRQQPQTLEEIQQLQANRIRRTRERDAVQNGIQDLENIIRQNYVAILIDLQNAIVPGDPSSTPWRTLLTVVNTNDNRWNQRYGEILPQIGKLEESQAKENLKRRLVNIKHHRERYYNTIQLVIRLGENITELEQLSKENKRTEFEATHKSITDLLKELNAIQVAADFGNILLPDFLSNVSNKVNTTSFTPQPGNIGSKKQADATKLIEQAEAAKSRASATKSAVKIPYEAYLVAQKNLQDAERDMDAAFSHIVITAENGEALQKLLWSVRQLLDLYIQHIPLYSNAWKNKQEALQKYADVLDTLIRFYGDDSDEKARLQQTSYYL